MCESSFRLELLLALYALPSAWNHMPTCRPGTHRGAEPGLQLLRAVSFKFPVRPPPPSNVKNVPLILHLHRYAKRSILNAFRQVFLAATDEHICNATCTPNETKCLRINTAKTWQDRFALHAVSLLQQVEGVNLHPEGAVSARGDGQQHGPPVTADQEKKS